MTLAELAALARKLREAERAVGDAEDALKAAKERLRAIAEEHLPTAMDELEVTEFTTTDGLRIKLGQVVHASISEANAAAAFAWLRDSGNSKIIKSQVTAIPSDDAHLRELEGHLRELGVEYATKASVHPSTLKAFVRGQLERGTDFPQEVFGVHAPRVAQVTSE